MSLRDHAPSRLLHGEEGAESGDLDCFPNRFGLDLGDRAGGPGARIVEDDIGRAEPADRPDSMLDPDAIALSYWNVLQQPRSAWSWELELRPWVEKF